MRASLAYTPLLLCAAAFATPRAARGDEGPGPGPVWELGLGLEHVSVTRDPQTHEDESGWGGQVVFLRGSVLGAITRRASEGAWMAGDYLSVGAGGWYGSEAHVRVPIEVGAQFGTVIASAYQLVVRAGVMGIATTGDADSGGFGTYFLAARGKWRMLALELGGGPRIDSDEGGTARLISATARYYFQPTYNVGFRFMNATRRVDPPSMNTLTDRSFFLFLSMEE